MSKKEEQLFDDMYAFVHLIANDYVELSHEKIAWQRDDYMRHANKLLDKIHSGDEHGDSD